MNDPGDYMPRDQVEHYKSRDPLILCRRHLAEAGAPESEMDVVEAEVEAAIEAALEFARTSPEPDVDAFVHQLPP